MPKTCRVLSFVATFLLATQFVSAANVSAYRESQFEKGKLVFIDHTPVLVVRGTPEEMGRQQAALTGDIIKTLSGYPRRLLSFSIHADQWQRSVHTARKLFEQAPKAHDAELTAMFETLKLERDLALVANTTMDIHRSSIACSSLIVEPSKSATGQPIFGRNLDFWTLGLLDKYGLVTIRLPSDSKDEKSQKKHAFASIGFPGLVGCLSGMNDAGLALAVHEVLLSSDFAPMLNPKGVPYTLCFRQILEQCTTVDEAEKLLRASERSTILSLTICDRKGGAVFELTPKTVAVRRGSDGLCINTNHFRTPELRLLEICPRYSTLSKAAGLSTLGIDDVAKQLDAVNQGGRTLQSMIFEPSPLVLHLAMGKCPATKEPYRRIELREFFEGSDKKVK